ncbi:MAG: EamA family transporter [Flavobacteriaceae bacterium]|nr:EamA family transporter [Flavobacteriaceae bacterium]
MQNSYIKNYLHLHFIVFIWGFTAVLGALITINAIPLVWYRVLLASLFILLFILIRKSSLKVSLRSLMKFLFGGAVIGLHWITFFYAIKVSNVSITLATMSTGALFTTLLQLLIFKEKIVKYELIFGLLAIVGLFMIFNAETGFTVGIIYALISSFLSASFAILNAEMVKTHEPITISFYELFFATLVITIILLFNNAFTADFFKLEMSDWFYLIILSSICTAYAFVASTKVLKSVSAFTMMLTINLEPVYGILLALLIFRSNEVMDINFYIGAILILVTVILNGLIKYRPTIFQFKSK